MVAFSVLFKNSRCSLSQLCLHHFTHSTITLLWELKDTRTNQRPSSYWSEHSAPMLSVQYVKAVTCSRMIKRACKQWPNTYICAMVMLYICEQKCSWMDDVFIKWLESSLNSLISEVFSFLQNNAGNSSSTQTYNAVIPKRFFSWVLFKKDWECVWKKKMPENFMEMETTKTKFWVCVSQLSCTTNTPVPPLNHMWTHKYMTTYKLH